MKPKAKKHGEVAKHIKDATEAHSDLNIFEAVVALLDSGLNSAHTLASTERIIATCRVEQQRCLKRFDAATAKIREI